MKKQEIKTGGHINHKDISPVDCVEYLEQLTKVGRAMSDRIDKAVHDCVS